jgi:hypothetical protein
MTACGKEMKYFNDQALNILICVATVIAGGECANSS